MDILNMILNDKNVSNKLKNVFNPTFKIYWIENGNRDFCGETDNPKKWLEENNKRRYEDVVCGDEYGDDHEQKICSCIERMGQFEFKLKEIK